MRGFAFLSLLVIIVVACGRLNAQAPPAEYGIQTDDSTTCWITVNVNCANDPGASGSGTAPCSGNQCKVGMGPRNELRWECKDQESEFHLEPGDTFRRVTPITSGVIGNQDISDTHDFCGYRKMCSCPSGIPQGTGPMCGNPGIQVDGVLVTAQVADGATCVGGGGGSGGGGGQ